jgi:hypothetical protein
MGDKRRERVSVYKGGKLGLNNYPRKGLVVW